MKPAETVALIALFFASMPAFGQERFAVEVEAGPAWQLRNDFAVPGEGGTRVRVEDRGPVPAARVTFRWQVSPRWSLRALAAPLSIESELTPDRSVLFQDATFTSEEPVQVDYRFDSYRVSALRHFGGEGRWSFRAGATLKLRDAEIGLRSDTARASKSNRGLVPLLHAGARFEPNDRWALDAEADAAAAPQGRALDAIVRVEGRVAGRSWLYVGARVLEGGADNDEVDTFATFAYLVAGARMTW